MRTTSSSVPDRIPRKELPILRRYWHDGRRECMVIIPLTSTNCNVVDVAGNRRCLESMVQKLAGRTDTFLL